VEPSLTAKEAKRYTLANIFGGESGWVPQE